MSIWETLGSVVAAIGTGGQKVFDLVVSAVSGRSDDTRRSVAFTAAMIALTAKMAKADGVVTPDEIVAFGQLFEMPKGEEKNVARLFNLAKQDVAGFEYYAGRIQRLFADDIQTLEDILDGLFHIAKADGVLHEAELAYLERVAEIFAITPAHFRCIKARHVEPQGSDPYAVLEVATTASDDEVKRRYRQLVAETHPDRLIARGVPAEFVRIANDRLAVINGAWAKIRAERGIA